MKKLFTAFALTAFLTPFAHAEDIISILERQSKVEQPAPPKIVPYNYTVDISFSEGKGDEVEAFTAKLLVNPILSGEERVRILSTSDEDYGDEFEEVLKEMRDPETTPEEMSEEFWCESGDNELFDGGDISVDDFTVISETDTEAVVKPNQALMAKIMMDGDDEEEMSKSDRKMMKKMMERLDGEFVLSKPDARLKNLKIWLTRPLTMKIVAKIKEMEITQSCAMAPNGFTYTDNVTMRVKAKALGVGMEQNMDIKITGLTLK